MASTVAISDAQQALAGRWRKVVPACTNLVEAGELIELPWLVRKLLKRPTGVNIKITPEAFHGEVVALGGLIKKGDSRPWDGQWREYRRSDGRHGGVQSRCMPIEGGMRLESKWGPPLAGTEIEENKVGPDGRLVSKHWLEVEGKGKVEYTTVYSRRR